MAYIKSKWKPYGASTKGYIVEITLRQYGLANSNYNRGCLAHFTSYNEKQYQQILRNIQRKFGIKYPSGKEIPLNNTAIAMMEDLGMSIEEVKVELKKPVQGEIPHN